MTQPRERGRRRRATILLLVVSILALLFVIITGFLGLARNDKQLAADRRKGDVSADVITEIREQIRDHIGEAFSNPGVDAVDIGKYENVPGYRGDFWLGHRELVWDEGRDLSSGANAPYSQLRPGGDWRNLGAAVWPAMSNFDGAANAVPQSFSVVDLVLEDAHDSDAEFVQRDIERYSRSPMLDADGDGIPDTALSQATGFNERANMLVGVELALGGIIDGALGRVVGGALVRGSHGVVDPQDLSGAARDAAERGVLALDSFLDSARYRIGARVFPNGSMVALQSTAYHRDSGGGVDGLPSNRNFVRGLFDSFSKQNDLAEPAPLAAYDTSNPRSLIYRNWPLPLDIVMDELGRDSTLVESLLRRRNGLPTWPGSVAGGATGAPDAAIPPILSFLEGRLQSGEYPQLTPAVGFPATFVPEFLDSGGNNRAKDEGWQRFNLADADNGNSNERAALLSSMLLRAETFNSLGSNPDPFQYDRRQSITVISHSDELTRKLEPAEPPDWQLEMRAPATPGPFYLTAAGALSTERSTGSRQMYHGPPNSTPNPSTPIMDDFYPPELSPPQAIPIFPRPLGSREGELRFWLGEIGKCFEAVEPTNGYIPGAGGPGGGGRSNPLYYRYVPQRIVNGDVVKVGDAVVERLADLYYDMLGGHSDQTVSSRDFTTQTQDDWSDDSKLAQNEVQNNREAVSRRQQALMLAVNTVQFYAPRSFETRAPAAINYIDVVSYIDWRMPIPPMAAGDVWYDEYVGWAPQPVFSEVHAYNKEETPTDPSEPPDENPRIALAVELFNPNDPYFQAGSDTYALRLEDFAISVGGFNPNAARVAPNPWQHPRWRQLVQPGGAALPPMPGRSFFTLVIRDDSAGNDNNHYDTVAATSPLGTLVMDLPQPDGDLRDLYARTDDRSDDEYQPGGDYITIDLWRRGWRHFGNTQAQGTREQLWFHVDRIKVDYPKRPKDWHTTLRDASPTAYLGAADYNGDGPIDYARWGTVTNRVHQANGSSSGGTDVSTLNSGKWFDGLVVDPDLTPTAPFAPHAPLITMNAGPLLLNAVSGYPTSLFERLNSLPLFGNQFDLRPRSFPTVGFMLYIPRFSHFMRVNSSVFATAPQEAQRFTPMSATLARQFRNANGGGAPPVNNWDDIYTNDYPVDFGHMPIFDNKQDTARETSPTHPRTRFDEVGKVPWGLLVFDYFTTLRPDRVDPLKVQGRVDINSAPWWMLSKLPVLGPTMANGAPLDVSNMNTARLPIRELPGSAYLTRLNAVADPRLGDPSPSFWEPSLGMVVGSGVNAYLPGTVFTRQRTAPSGASDAPGVWYRTRPAFLGGVAGQYELGEWLAQSAVAYRDGIQYESVGANNPPEFETLADAQVRNGVGTFFTANHTTQNGDPYRRTDTYGDIRGQVNDGTKSRPEHFGFLTVGELINAKGFDATVELGALTQPQSTAAVLPLVDRTVVQRGDFLKAVSVLTMLDSQFLTTRSNTFTAYVSAMDTKNPDASVTAQFTIDRSNMLPKREYEPAMPGFLRTQWQTNSWGPAPQRPSLRLTPGDPQPDLIIDRRVPYYNARYDQ